MTQRRAGKDAGAGRARPLVGRALVALWLGTSGCGVVRDDVDGLLTRGEPGAALGQLRTQPEGTTPRSRARYGLRRGLAHLGLGDTETARFWLARARAVVDLDPDALGPDDRARLFDAVRGAADPLHAGRLLYRRAS